MKKEIFKLITLILIFIQILIIVNDKNKKNKEIKEEKKNDDIIESITSNNDKIKEEKEINNTIIIEIPKIKLKKIILPKEDKNNNIDKNVTILKESSYPNEEGNIFIAAHSGNGSHSYFNDIVKLKKEDEIYLYYQNIKYKYLLKEIKYITKETNSSIVTQEKNNLFLITCSQNKKGKYLILIFKNDDKIPI